MNLFSVWDSDALEIAHDHFILRRQSEDRTARLHQRKQKQEEICPQGNFLAVNQEKSETNKDFRSGFR
jgi:hypothetical protein